MDSIFIKLRGNSSANTDWIPLSMLKSGEEPGYIQSPTEHSTDK